ncbi:MAG: hypothetical protein ACR2GP_12095 [Burkholderiaceae bacterium]
MSQIYRYGEYISFESGGYDTYDAPHSEATERLLENPESSPIISMEFTSPDLQLRLLDTHRKEPTMRRLDCDLPEPSLISWSRTAHPIHIGSGGEIEVDEPYLQQPRAAAEAAGLDDILFGSSAVMLLLVPLVILPLAAWLR